MRATTLGLVALLIAGVAPAASAAPAGWQPEPATFGVSAPVFTSVRMDDGVMISTEVVYPTDPASGARAAGNFPVLLTQNPYGAGRSDPTSGGKYFVQRGYIYVASAIRGTGTSGGQVDWFGDRQGRDGAELVDWAARALPGSDGLVGLDGCSYLGVDQWFTAAAVGRHSALKTIAPFCTDSDFYNDLTADGGIPTSFVAGIAHAEPRGPQDDPATDPQSVTIAQQATGGPRAYDNDYWQQLDVQRLMPTIVANGIPALSEAGWQDLFPGGNLGTYVASQNAYFHRPLTAPVTAREPTTGRYQAIVGPWTHGEHVNEASLQSIRLEWFDTWLKGARTGMADTRTPLHLFENTASRWVDTAAWPPSPTASSFRFDGGDTLAWAPGSSLTYTTAPLTRSMVLDGPSDLTVYASSTTPEVELSATLNVLAADGHVVKQADGILLGSQRQLDTAQSWYADGTLIQPSHPFTQASQRAVPVGRSTRYDLSLLANFTEITAGQRIQVVLTTQPPANFHLAMAPTPRQLAGLADGVYTIQHATLNLPLAAPDRFRTSSADWGPIS
ncbi:CocE/NonD family hydrolase [Kutzneria sp. NPDC051319]|uniref:CocE/NonD family hydrolase n=1 Tax=Kutzneria sp. NPDC051319 TaxID=3155047 RepID=UPI003441F9E1